MEKLKVKCIDNKGSEGSLELNEIYDAIEGTGFYYFGINNIPYLKSRFEVVKDEPIPTKNEKLDYLMGALKLIDEKNVYAFDAIRIIEEMSKISVSDFKELEQSLLTNSYMTYEEQFTLDIYKYFKDNGK